MSARTTALNYARSYVGTKEHPAGTNRGPQIDKWQKAVDMIAQPWCGAFVHACLNAAGVKGLSSRMRFVPYIVADARAGVNGLKSLVSWEDALPGDLAIYQWDTGDVDHVGIIESVLSSTEVALEGNTAVGNDSNGGEVMRRTRSRSLVAYIARPKYPDAPRVPLTPCEWPGGEVIKRGTKGAKVKVIQGWVNTLDDAGYDYKRLTVDGDFGPATESAVKLYQSRHRLDADGVVGPLTWRAMCSSVRAAA